MKTAIHALFLVLILLTIKAELSLAQRDKVYQTMESALVNPDSVFVMHLKFDNENQFSPLEQLRNLDTLLIFSDDSCHIPDWFFEIPAIQNLSHLQLPSRLNSFPKGLAKLKNLKSLDVAGNKELFLVIPEQILELNNLEYLDLTHCGLVNSYNASSFPDDFHKLKSLKKINLTNNEIEFLPAVFYKLKSLEALDLTNNKITSLPETVSKLTHLKEFILSHNNISSLPKSFSKLKNLNYLSLFGNNLSALPASFSNLSNLEHLNISNNNFDSFPKVILELRQLSCFKFDLTHPLPEDFHQLINLKKLEIGLESEWNLSASAIYSLKNLEELQVYHTFWLLEYVLFVNYPKFHLSDSISLLSNLKKLDIRGLSFFNFNTLPMGLKKLEYLEELNISSNVDLFRDSFPEVLFHLPNLKRLDLSSCYISNFPSQLKKSKNITHLYLHNNQLEEVPAFIFSLRELEVLNISNNKLKTIPLPLTQLNKLQNLDLSRNDIADLPNEIANLSKLENLKISDNAFKSFPLVINELTALKVLYI